ncbi:MAG: thioesterase family protein [Gemmatimonadota bacterium]
MTPEVEGARPAEGASTALSDFPVVVEVPVRWADMDAFGHVNNTLVFRYFESARIVYLERCGFERSYEETRIGPILHSTACRFRRPLFYPDTILVGARTVELYEDRFMTQYRAVSTKLDEVASEGSSVIVSYDYDEARKAPIPAAVRAMILELDGARLNS